MWVDDKLKRVYLFLIKHTICKIKAIIDIGTFSYIYVIMLLKRNIINYAKNIINYENI